MGKDVPMRVLSGMLALLLLTVPALAADATGSSDEPKEKAPPSFQPGAKVELAIALHAPVGWAINHQVPLRLEFDEDYVASDEQPEDAQFSTEKAKWDFTLERYEEEYMAAVVVQLAGELPDGEITLPLTVLCSICDDAGDACTFSMEEISVPLVVRSKAPKDEKNQAQAKGTLTHEHRLALLSV